jgi:Domain of unknown function (DUF6429)
MLEVEKERVVLQEAELSALDVSHLDHRAWKSHDWDALDRLHAKGYISDPKSKAKSIVFGEEDERRVRELFERHFGRKV